MNTMEQLAMTRWSRRTLLKASGVGAAGFTLAQADFIRTTAQESDEIQNILDITATTERFGVTFLGEGIRAAEAGEYDVEFPDAVIAILKAARAQEQFHLDTFEGLGGEALVDTFTAPPDAFTSFDVFFTALVDQEARETASQIAAMTVFTELGRSDLAKVSFQYAAEEAEHRLLANYTLGVRPANDRAFADNLFVTIEDFYAALEEAGIIGGPGPKITYPGPGEIDDSNVIETEPGGPEASCNVIVDATPAAGATPAIGGNDDESTPVTEDADEAEDDDEGTPSS